MVDDRYLGGKGDVAVHPISTPEAMEKWRVWARTAGGHDCQMIAQL